jgi:hypothetical protein
MRRASDAFGDAILACGFAEEELSYLLAVIFEGDPTEDTLLTAMVDELKRRQIAV